MSTPASLKPIAPFLAKAKETEKADPIISYHCKLYAAQLIVDQGLHQKDTEAAVFTGNLLDEIEKLKDEDPVLASEKGQAVISDDTVASSYVEAFALKIFARADRLVREQATDKTTAQMFFAAATFFEVAKLFGELDKDVADKIKYSKFHAARILRALKAGEDPNEFVVEEEEAPEEEEDIDSLPEEEQIKRLMADMKKEADGEPAGDAAAEDSHVTLPSDSVDPFDMSSMPPAPPKSIPGASAAAPTDYGLPPAPPRTLPGDPAPPAPPKNLPGESAAPAPTLPSPQRKVASPVRPKAAVAAPVDPAAFLDEDALIKQAQKHAKFAISALNYEDKATAVRELQAAMDLLTT